MRILKEYAALLNPVPDSGAGVILPLIPGNKDKAADYVEEITRGTGLCANTLISLKVAASDIFSILAEYAAAGESARIFCTYHKYYYMLAFEFSESALPLHTLNKSVKMLNPATSKQPAAAAEAGFMDLVHLVNRIGLSVDKVNEKMRLTVIKEKRYSVDGCGELPPLAGEFRAAGEPSDFSKRLYQKFGKNIDKFLISSRLLLDNIAAGELETVFLTDKNGNCAGGAVWQKTYGIAVLMVFALFTDDINAKDMLLDAFKEKIAESKADYVITELRYSEVIADYFDTGDEKYRYKSLVKQKRQISYIKPDLMPLIKKACKDFELSRDIRQINYNYSFIEPHSVLTARVDADASEAVLSVMWFGDDLKSNIIRHITALKKLGIETVYFTLNAGIYEEMAVSDLICACGFEAKYLLPYSGERGDTVVFVYLKDSVYEIKPCVISPIDKRNIDKTPALVRKVYGDNYPSQYLYSPEKLWDKIRKRNVYPFIAIDDEDKAVGLISFVKLTCNPYLFEIGQLMVDPVHRGTDVVNQLIGYVYSTALKTLDFDAVTSESVTNHKLSQRSCVNSGFCDCALKLNIMSENAFLLEDARRRIGRMSCVVSCIERADENFTVYLPPVYANYVRYCFEGLKPRNFISDYAKPETGGITEYRVDDAEAATSLLFNVTLFSIGEDLDAVTEKIERHAESRGIKTILVNIPLADARCSAAAEALKARGFFFGGVMPYWFTESDALLMQKLCDGPPDWDGIKLFSGKIKKIAEFIREDMG